MKVLTSLSAVVLMSGATFGIAYAQQLPLPQLAPPEAQAQAESQPLAGDLVFSSEGEEIGTIEEVMINADESVEVIISVGQFLGFGGKLVAVPESALTARLDGGFSVSYTGEQLESMPAYEREI